MNEMVITFGGTVTDVFGSGGAASSVTALLATAIGGSVASMIAGVMGQSTIGSMIKVLTTLSCIGIMIGAVARTLGSLGMSW